MAHSSRRKRQRSSAAGLSCARLRLHFGRFTAPTPLGKEHVNLGDDADTTGAIYGQLAGAYYGVTAIPQDWIGRLALREYIDEKATALFDFSNEWDET
jgi:ADP-ribosylglycohydrolase